MAPIDDRQLVHDLRNSMMVIRNLAQLLQEDKLKGKDKDHALDLIRSESEKVIKQLQ